MPVFFIQIIQKDRKNMTIEAHSQNISSMSFFFGVFNIVMFLYRNDICFLMIMCTIVIAQFYCQISIFRLVKINVFFMDPPKLEFTVAFRSDFPEHERSALPGIQPRL